MNVYETTVKSIGDAPTLRADRQDVDGPRGYSQRSGLLVLHHKGSVAASGGALGSLAYKCCARVALPGECEADRCPQTLLLPTARV